MTRLEPIRLHADQTFFREAVAFTAARTGFVPRLVEKDYFCTLVLQYLAGRVPGLIFKGGTCLAKVHADFYRLSEDLDFAIPVSADAPRAARSRLAAPAKDAVAGIQKHLSGFRLVAGLGGRNNCTQYLATVGYPTLLSDQEETIKLEIGLREPLLTPELQGEAHTLLLNPLVNAPMAPVLGVSCLSREEAMAEKLRAALTRREAAIRDFYDVDYAARVLDFKFRLPGFLALVRKKLAVPRNQAVDVSESRLMTLRLQVDAQLRPVLRKRGLAEFDLGRAFALVSELAAAVADPPAGQTGARAG